MENNFKNVFKDKKVLITGHTGFKGAWLSLWLKELGADVLGYSLSPSATPNLYDIFKLNDRINSVIGDIKDFENLKSIFNAFRPEFVFHLAAQPLVRYSYSEPRDTYDTNVMGTVNILEAIKNTQEVRVFINITSDKCYRNNEWIYSYREDDPLGGYDPYSSSKAASELVTSAYRDSFFNPKEFNKTHQVAVSSVRAGNVIGGGDWALDRIMPDCVRSLSRHEPITIRNPKAIRPWQLVLEPLSGYLHLASLMYLNGINYSSSWNFGPEEQDILTVEQVVTKAIESWGCGEYEIISDSNFHEATSLRIDISKAKIILKWQPVYGSEFAIKETTNWYKKYYQGENMHDYSINQIKNYSHIASQKQLNWSLNDNEKINIR